MHRPSRGKVRAVLVVVAVATVIVGGLVHSYFFGPEDPVYNGRKLSSHLHRALPFHIRDRRFGSEEHVKAKKEAGEALDHLGPRCIPLIKEWFNTRESRWASRLRDLAFNYNLPFPSILQNREMMAIWAIRRAPGNFEALIPDVSYRITNGDIVDRYPVSVLLYEILVSRELQAKRPWPETYAAFVPALLEGTSEDTNGGFAYANLVKLILENSSSPDAITRDRIVGSILRTRGGDKGSARHFYKSAAMVDPEGKIRSALLNGADPQGRVAAALSFQPGQKPAQEIVPILLEGIGSTNELVRKRVVDELGAYGRRAHFAVPTLSNLMKNAESGTAEQIKRTISYIQMDIPTLQGE